FGPRVTRTASASLFMPASRERRAVSSKAISLGIGRVLRWTVACDGSHSQMATASTLDPRVLTGNSAPRPRVKRTKSAPGDRREDGYRLAVGHRSVEAVEEANVVVGHEHVDEPAQAAVVVEEAVREAGVGGIEALQDLRHGGALHLDGGTPARQWAKGGGDAHGDGHECRGYRPGADDPQ